MTSCSFNVGAVMSCLERVTMLSCLNHKSPMTVDVLAKFSHLFPSPHLRQSLMMQRKSTAPPNSPRKANEHSGLAYVFSFCVLIAVSA